MMGNYTILAKVNMIKNIFFKGNDVKNAMSWKKTGLKVMVFKDIIIPLNRGLKLLPVYYV